jgi:hypothetical protein
VEQQTDVVGLAEPWVAISVAFEKKSRAERFAVRLGCGFLA